MLSDNEKAANKRFYEVNGKSPHDEARGSAAHLGALTWVAVVIAIAAGIYSLLH